MYRWKYNIKVDLKQLVGVWTRFSWLRLGSRGSFFLWTWKLTLKYLRS